MPEIVSERLERKLTFFSRTHTNVYARALDFKKLLLDSAGGEPVKLCYFLILCAY